MFSSLTTQGAAVTLAALAAGASDYVTKPSACPGGLDGSIAAVRAELLPRIHALCDRVRPAVPPMFTPRLYAGPVPFAAAGPVRVVVGGASTGGPEALRRLIADLPATLPVPVLVVQHMPAVFTAMLARRLDAAGGLAVVEAANGTALRPGTVYLAPGGRHLEVTRTGATVRTRLHDGPRENHCRPATDVLFRSAAAAYGAGVLAVVLTGMGVDGRRGCEALRAAGAHIAVQDEQTSVVWGMPGAVVAARLADAVLPLSHIAPYVVARFPRLATAPTAAPGCTR